MNAQRRQTFKVLQQAVRLVTPPEPISIADWADEHRILSPEDSAEKGPWKTSRSPFQKVPMEAISDKNVESVVMMWGLNSEKRLSNSIQLVILRAMIRLQLWWCSLI